LLVSPYQTNTLAHAASYREPPLRAEAFDAVIVILPRTPRESDVDTENAVFVATSSYFSPRDDEFMLIYDAAGRAPYFER